MNNNFLPISIIPDIKTCSVQKAFKDFWRGSCDVVHFYDIPIKTPSSDQYYWPSVIVRRTTKLNYNKINLKKESLLLRDDFTCQYCEKEISENNCTCDHVIPKSKGGKSNWSNIVASCKDCNETKASADPIGRWRPKKAPHIPTFMELLDKRRKYPLTIYDEAWTEFLPNFCSYRMIDYGTTN